MMSQPENKQTLIPSISHTMDKIIVKYMKSLDAANISQFLSLKKIEKSQVEELLNTLSRGIHDWGNIYLNNGRKLMAEFASWISDPHPVGSVDVFVVSSVEVLCLYMMLSELLIREMIMFGLRMLKISVVTFLPQNQHQQMSDIVDVEIDNLLKDSKFERIWEREKNYLSNRPGAYLRRLSKQIMFLCPFVPQKYAPKIKMNSTVYSIFQLQIILDHAHLANNELIAHFPELIFMDGNISYDTPRNLSHLWKDCDRTSGWLYLALSFIRDLRKEIGLFSKTTKNYQLNLHDPFNYPETNLFGIDSFNPFKKMNVKKVTIDDIRKVETLLSLVMH